MTATLIVLGATGDLTARYLLPGLAQLAGIGRLPGVRLVGVATDALDDEGFRARVSTALERNASMVDDPLRAGIARTARYVRGDVTDPETLRSALDLADGDGAVVVYLALPHVLFEPVAEALSRCDLPADARVVVEKPFGDGLAGAQSLNRTLARTFSEDRVFRVDHFLAKQTVLNLLGLRFANRIFEPLWSSTHIEGVDIVFEETVDAQARAAYYDRSGALRDMLQNHLLQILSLVAMEPPLTMSPADLSARKVDVLRAVRPMSREEVDRGTVRARYTAGQVEGREVAAYADAPGVDRDRGTETYVEAVLHIDNWRWAGVPFRLRTGKAMAADRREVVVRFRDVPHQAFAEGEPGCNELRLQLDPDRMSLRVNVNGIGDPFDLETVDLEVELARQAPSAYGQLLLAILEGDTRLSARAGEAEEAWRITECILAGWGDGAAPLRDYAAGSAGPGLI
jgi:glucose-6-phosphate 1-dehydrogenase